MKLLFSNQTSVAFGVLHDLRPLVLVQNVKSTCSAVLYLLDKDMWLNSSNINSCLPVIDCLKKPKLEKRCLFLLSFFRHDSYYVNTFIQDD